jgi:hypothetical protein
MGATPHRLAKEASLANLWGLSPATTNSVAALSVPMPGKETNSGAASATSLSRCASRCVLPGSRPQLLDPSLGTTQEAIDLKAVGVGAECLVTAGYRTECEFGGRLHVSRINREAEACGHTDQLLRGESAQTVAQLLGCRHAQGLDLVGGL